MSVYIRELARELGKHGHHIDIFTCRRTNGHAPVKELDPRVRLINLGAELPKGISKSALYHHLPEIYFAMEEFRNREDLSYDLIHSHYWLSGLLGSWARDDWDVPHVLMFHTLGEIKNRIESSERESELRILHERKLAQISDRIIVATEKEKENLTGLGDIAKEKISVVPCGVNLLHFRPMDKCAARKALNLDPQALILLYVGRFVPLKGIDRLLGALTHLEHYQRLRLLVVGGDGIETPMARNLAGLARKLEIEKLVTFLGRIDHEELPPYYSAADVLVIPSDYESFGLVALEALACGTPVVATAVGAVETIIREGETGSIVPDLKPRSLARGIDALLSETRGGKISPDLIRSSVLKFGWDNIAEAVAGEYAALLHPRPEEHEQATSAKRLASIR
jgi:D-inositol-3-phosphate glycosyltransferase